MIRYALAIKAAKATLLCPPIMLHSSRCSPSSTVEQLTVLTVEHGRAAWDTTI